MKTIANPLSVFIVDDDPMFLHTLAHSVQDAATPDVKVSIFSSGEECLTHMDEKPDVVVLDYYLQNEAHPYAMNGIDVLKKIKSRSNDTKVIMLSAQDKLEVASASIKAGAFDYVAKSESAPARLRQILGNAFNNMNIVHDNQLYENRNIAMGVALLAMIVFDIIYYAAH